MKVFWWALCLFNTILSPLSSFSDLIDMGRCNLQEVCFNIHRTCKNFSALIGAVSLWSGVDCFCVFLFFCGRC
uniref:Secreted protein n=1 Tax=Rhizophora mucronata TaxID=61149 RepID=A0A2P2PPG6_RHIMU